MSVPSTMRGLVPTPTGTLPADLRSDLPVPAVRSGEVLVRVTHTTVNGHEFGLAQQPLLRAIAFMRGARGKVKTGLEFAGVVASEGRTFRRGDIVLGYSEVAAGVKPHGDYVAIPEAYIARIPDGLSPAEASTLPMSGMTALAAVREVADLGPGKHVLVLGATGGVGVLTVQLAHMLGATITVYANSTHHEKLKQLGATHTIDYRETAIADVTGPFDAVLDFSDTLGFRDVRHLLTDDGVFVPADPMSHLLEIVCSKKARYLLVDRGDTATLNELTAWVNSGELTPIIDQEFGLHDWKGAVRHSLTRGRFGRTVLAFSEDEGTAAEPTSDIAQ